MKNQRPQKINSQKELDDLIKKVKGGYPLECFVLLNFGLREALKIYPLMRTMITVSTIQ